MNNKILNQIPLIKGMGRFKSAKKFGASPGSVIYTEDKKIESVQLHITDFDLESVEQYEIQTLEEMPEKKRDKRWFHIKGLHDTDLLSKIGDMYSIHPLVLEDVANPNQFAKIEEFDEYLFVITKMVLFDDDQQKLVTEHLCFILMQDIVISFQETDAGHFDPIIKRLENPKARMRKFGVDYFLYALLDLVVDHYFLTIDALNDFFEQLELDVMDNPQQYHVEEIHRLKRQVVMFRRAVRPLREVVNMLMDESINLISEDIDVFLRDLYDHALQAIDLLETQRELASGLMDTYLSQVSHRMNEVMKVLTIMSTIFIPLGFLAGVYGMNFDFMPELHFRYSYFILLGVMVTAVIGMLLLFRHKRWL